MKLGDLIALRDRLQAETAHLAREKEYALWWCVSGYADIIADAVKRIERAHARIEKIYGERGITFDETTSARVEASL